MTELVTLVFFALLALTAPPAAGQDVAPGIAQIGSIQGTTSATCSVYRATGGSIVVAGTWVGTLQFESSTDGVTYLALPVTPQAGGSTVTSTAANGTWNFTNAGYVSPSGVRVRASAWTSGLATTSCTTVGAMYSMSGGTTTAFGALSTPILEANGTAAAPSYSFSSDPGTGWEKSAANTITFTTASVPRISLAAAQLLFNSSGNIGFGSTSDVTTSSFDVVLSRAATGQLIVAGSGSTIGSVLKVDTLPTVSSCGAGSPAVTAGSTPMAGSVTVGTGAPATCTITFGGTAYPSAPHCSGAVETTTAANVRAMGYSATTTALTIVPTAAWADSSVVNWSACISSK